MDRGNDMVKVVCYGREREMRRSDAIEFFMEGMLECDGCEAERYTNIYLDLMAGKYVCSDGQPLRKKAAYV